MLLQIHVFMILSYNSVLTRLAFYYHFSISHLEVAIVYSSASFCSYLMNGSPGDCKENSIWVAEKFTSVLFLNPKYLSSAMKNSHSFQITCHIICFSPVLCLDLIQAQLDNLSHWREFLWKDATPRGKWRHWALGTLSMTEHRNLNDVLVLCFSVVP